MEKGTGQTDSKHILRRLAVLGSLVAALYFSSKGIAHQILLSVGEERLRPWGGELGLVPLGFLAFAVIVVTIDVLFARGIILFGIGSYLGLAIPGLGASLKSLRRHYTEPPETLEAEYQRDHGRDPSELHGKMKISRWVICELIPRYENNLNGLVYIGAAVLIVTIGLRGLEVITREEPLPLVWALQLEFFLVGLLGAMVFFKPEDNSHNTVRVQPTLGTLASAERELIRQVQHDLGVLAHILCQQESLLREAQTLGLDEHLRRMKVVVDQMWPPEREGGGLSGSQLPHRK